MNTHISISGVKRRKGPAGVNMKRNNSLSFTLPLLTGEHMSVCKVMFMHTLGMKTDGMITEFVKAKVKGEANAISPTVDGRGHHAPSTKFNRDLIKEHINSYHPQISHYNREHAPNRRYLEPHLTITDMWNDFTEKHTQISYELYRQVFQTERITFGEPSQDQCETCLSHNMHVKEQPEGHDETSCDQCLAGRNHLERARKSRHEYQKELPDGVSVYAVDMQRVILLPKLSTKESFFVTRLVVFNETFASITPDKRDYVILWHEGIAGRLAANVASSFIKCIILDSSPRITFWADNCSGQNKNWTLYTALVQCVNAEWGPDEVVIKYLQKGHTFMKADSVHGSIGRRMKKRENIFTFDDFVELCNSASKRIMSIVMSCEDFYGFSGEQRTRGKKVQMPLLASICEVKFTKGKRSISFKDFDDNYTEVDFLRPRFKSDTFPPKQGENRGIPLTKKQAINKLMHVAPAAKKWFWMEIAEQDVDDLATST